jgi:hypothetical protein
MLDAGHTRAAAHAIYRFNFRENFRGHHQQPRAFCTEDDQGLLLCTWPHGDRPAVPTQYSHEVWTGIEYAVAGLLIYEGQTEPAVRMLDAVRARYDGRKQSPWNDIECGDHYVRAMSSWSLLEAASGYAYDAGSAEIAFAPQLTPGDFRAPFFACDGWGTFTQKIAGGVQTCTLHIVWGKLLLQTLRLRVPNAISAIAVHIDNLPVNITTVQANGDITIVPAERISLQTGQTLEVVIRA